MAVHFPSDSLEFYESDDWNSTLQKCFRTFPRSAPRLNSFLEVYVQFLQPHDLALTFSIMSIQLYLPQVDYVVETS